MERIQNAFLVLELCPFFDLDFLSSIKYPTDERWHLRAVLLFILKLREYPCNNTYDIYTHTPRIFVDGKNDIPRLFIEHEYNFCGERVTFNDAVPMIHEVNKIADPFPYTAKFMFFRHNNAKQIGYGY